MTSATNAWYRREERVVGRWWRVRCCFDDRFPDGHVVEPGDDPGDGPGDGPGDREFFGLPVRSDAQVAAIRWFRAEACVEQVHVAPEQRRHHMATKVIYAASAFHQASGWVGRLHSDGRRTDLGEQLVVGLRHADRIAPWEQRMAPMDPAAD